MNDRVHAAARHRVRKMCRDIRSATCTPNFSQGRSTREACAKDWQPAQRSAGEVPQAAQLPQRLMVPQPLAPVAAAHSETRLLSHPPARACELEQPDH